MNRQPLSKRAAVLPNEQGESPSKKRDIPKDHPYDPKSLKPLAKTLWATSVSLGHALTAHRHLSRMKSTTISPDGLLGGRGYVMAIKDIRNQLYNACEALSSIADTVHDEIKAPHWKPRLAELDANAAEDVERFLEESQEILDNPEGGVEDEMDSIESENDEGSGEEETASKLPDAGKSDANYVESPSTKSRLKEATSSIPVDSLPGPRVNHIGPGEGRGPFGSYNPSEDYAKDPDRWSADEGVGSDENYYVLASAWASSVLPVEPGLTRGDDFGYGYGPREGLDYENPSDEGRGKGVWGPHSGLPGAPTQSPGDSTSAVLDSKLNYHRAHASLPGDFDEPVARSDYYDGPKGNLVQSQSVLPSEDSATVEQPLPALDTYYMEEDLNTNYVSYDYNFSDHPLVED